MPSLADHAVIPGSAPLVPELDAAWALLERAVSLDPASAAVHAARGNALLRRGKADAARRSYELAARLDPGNAPVRIALGELTSMAGDDANAQIWFAQALAQTRVYSPTARSGARPALVLALAGPWHRNVPLDFIVDPAAWTLHRWYVPLDGNIAGIELPPHDLVIDAIAASVDAGPALATAQRFIERGTAPAINAPARVQGTGRERLAATLRGIPGCSVPAVIRAARDELAQAEIAFPALVRPVDTHGGRGLVRLDDAAALAAYAAAALPGDYDLTPFVDYRSADGFYRKYRVMFVDGEPLPYHLAIDAGWMIHYRRAPMAEHAWMRAEEERFLRAPAETLGCMPALEAVAAAIGLDYAGIDCTVLADGTLLVFEADAAMLVHGFDAAPEKRAAVERIRRALAALFARRTG